MTSLTGFGFLFSRFKDTDFFVKQFLLWKVKNLNFESSAEAFKDLRSVYKVHQLFFSPGLILTSKIGSIPWKPDLDRALKVERFCREKPDPPPPHLSAVDFLLTWLFWFIGFSRQKRPTLRARSRSSFQGIDPIFEVKIKHGENNNWWTLYTDLRSLSASAKLSKFRFFTFHSKNCFTKKSVSLNLLKRNPNPVMQVK